MLATGDVPASIAASRRSKFEAMNRPVLSLDIPNCHVITRVY